MIENTFSRPDTVVPSMRAALLLELAQENVAQDGSRLTYARLVARKLIDLALAGDMRAIKEINDRVEGKPHQRPRARQPGTIVVERDDGGSSQEGGGANGGNSSARDKCGSPGTPSGTADVAPPKRVERAASALSLSCSPARPNHPIDFGQTKPTVEEMSSACSVLSEDAADQHPALRCDAPEPARAGRHFGRTKPMSPQASIGPWAYCVPAMPACCTTLPQRRISALTKSRSPPIDGFCTGSIPFRAI
jgi:hypothetical protein